MYKKKEKKKDEEKEKDKEKGGERLGVAASPVVGRPRRGTTGRAPRKGFFFSLLNFLFTESYNVSSV